MTKLFCFGLGFSALALARKLKADGWSVTGTSRSGEKCRALAEEGFETVLFNGEEPGGDIAEPIARATHVLVSVPPQEADDPVLTHHASDLANAKDLKWIGYLSTVGVYGNHDGDWVDENTEPQPRSKRSHNRLAAERAWTEFGAQYDVPVHLFRLSGIYGPGRNAIANLKKGRARRVVRKGQVFNRIHVADIATVLSASISRGNEGGIYNITDDYPAPPQDVIAYAAGLLGHAPPPEVPFENAELSPMGRSFYGENKRVANTRIKSELAISLAYPTYRHGLTSLLCSEEGLRPVR